MLDEMITKNAERAIKNTVLFSKCPQFSIIFSINMQNFSEEKHKSIVKVKQD